MKLSLTLLFVTVAGAFAADATPDAATPAAAKPEEKTPEQLRKSLKKRGLQASDGSDAGGDTGGGSGCFSAVTTVDVQGQGPVSMDSLNIGDFVRAGKEGEYTRVFSFAHNDRDIEYDFVQIHTEGTEAPIELTKNHMLFVDNKAVPAEAVKVGDLLGDKKVVDIASVKRNGLFAPITESGEIVVNGVRASCYVAILDHVFVNQHYMTHMFFSYQRAACSYNFALCENETYTNGFSNWSNWAIQLYMKANTLSAPLQHFLGVVSLFVLPAWFTAEQFIVSPFLAVAAVGYLVYKSNTKKVKSA
ncbi:Warthog protein [Seminavis robusta]|uniref:Warthog protein n=1 Tax=Seminavis robusta TaxID=568900 RepID=A0A9N8DPB0_9STRA|nr:Warthog protein [Seminavis robusta]|eukprot:Sro274_g105310.1 Warthog protein (303) ;mRNA; f:16081-16989